ncbi:hypothetical protein SELMODRAFT_414132 [Selaginella moellendorffii]|uniref:Uncharacterized protein n=1 Tax=Selaginella moellendorffii TaxID=88036 RepID=D8RRR4_SELML|nr:hypothetical protein SELMODRAFT_414132 [Selaginella moellendorffii]
MAIDNNLKELSFTAMHKRVCPLSLTANAGEVAILIGDYMFILGITMLYAILGTVRRPHELTNLVGVPNEIVLEKESAFEDILRRFCNRSTLITCLDDVEVHMDQSQFHLPIYAECMAQHFMQHEPIVKEHSAIPIPAFLDIEAKKD